MFRGLSRSSRRQAFPHKSAGLLLPRAGLLFDIPNRYPFVDRVGANTRTLYGLQYLHLAGATDFTNASITGTEAVTSQPAGTAAITVAAGKLTIGAGDLWTFTLSNGSTYEFGTALTATTGVVFDTSGNGRHLLFTVADTAAVVCLGGREKGSDYLDEEGLTLADGEQYPNQDARKQIPLDIIIPSGSTFSFASEANNFRVVLLGDSITSTAADELTSNSFESDKSRDWAYFTWLNIFCGQKFVVARNLAYGGQNSEYALSKVSEALSYNPGYIVVLTGTNDLISTSTATVISNLTNIYNQIINSGVGLICLPINPNININTEALLLKYNTINSFIQEFCSAHNNAYYVDTRQNLITYDGIYPRYTVGTSEDGVHPNVSGSIKMANVLFPFMDALPTDIPVREYKNIFTNPTLIGTSGQKWGNVTGTVATGLICNDSSSYSIGAVASIVNYDDRNWQVLSAIGGSSSSDCNIGFTFSGYSVGDILEAYIDFDITDFVASGSSPRIELYFRASGGALTFAYSLKHNEPNVWSGDITNLKGTIKTCKLIVPSGTTAVTLYMHIQSPSFTIKVANPVVTKVSSL